MLLDWPHGLDLVLLTAGYAGLDFLLRQDGWARGVGRLGLGPRLAAVLWLAPCLCLAPFCSWGLIPQGRALRLLAGVLAAAMAWQASTRDIDPVLGETHFPARVAVVACTVGTWFSPAFFVAEIWLLSTPFSLWQHHATLPMRLMLAMGAHLILTGAFAALSGLAGIHVRLFPDAAALIFFVMMVAISHYFITALAKCRLGPKWYSWVTDNHLHHLAASAYSWGWARFLPWRVWHRVIAAAKRGERLLQFLAFGLELLSPLALLRREVAIGFCLAWAGFHLGVFALSGLLFWDWMAADLALAAMLARLPPAAVATVFGPVAVAASLIFMFLFPLRHRLWKPMPLGWFDTPFTQRVHWRVRGESGKEYGLYNDFMCPHERLYGKVNGCFLAPVAVLTYHLGEVWKPELRDALCAAGPSLERLEAVRARFGIRPGSAEMAANHIAYLRRFLRAVNRGRRKHVLPRGLRWLKAPGDQVYYWGELPAYRGQEKAAAVRLFYREEYFDGTALRRLREETLVECEVEGGEPPPAARELTPKELDDFLLGHAAGRLIDLPGFGGGFVRGDDGRPGVSPTAKTGSG